MALATQRHHDGCDVSVTATSERDLLRRAAPAGGAWAVATVEADLASAALRADRSCGNDRAWKFNERDLLLRGARRRASGEPGQRADGAARTGPRRGGRPPRRALSLRLRSPLSYETAAPAGSPQPAEAAVVPLTAAR